jgi:hypothetical protein
MKIRNGFVSNSSSSSFIVNPGILFEIPSLPAHLRDPGVLKVPYQFGGNYEFGRERQDYKDLGSRLNWAYLQARSVRDTYEAKTYLSKSFIKERTAFVEKHKDDVTLLEKVLLDTIPGLNKIVWYLVTDMGMKDIRNSYKGDEKYKYDYEQHYIEGYIDHGSLWYEKPKLYEEIFENSGTIFQWLFGIGNYIANRSDEYEDEGELEVNHRFDYDLDKMYLDNYYDPELFDTNGNFIKDGGLKIVANKIEDIKAAVESGEYKYVHYFTDNQENRAVKKYAKEKGWGFECTITGSDYGTYIVRLWKC